MTSIGRRQPLDKGMYIVHPDVLYAASSVCRLHPMKRDTCNGPSCDFVGDLPGQTHKRQESEGFPTRPKSYARIWEVLASGPEGEAMGAGKLLK